MNRRSNRRAPSVKQPKRAKNQIGHQHGSVSIPKAKARSSRSSNTNESIAETKNTEGSKSRSKRVSPRLTKRIQAQKPIIPEQLPVEMLKLKPDQESATVSSFLNSKAASGKQMIILRPASDHMIRTAITNAMSGKPPKLFSGDQVGLEP
jgi:hypothetical protein